MLPYKRIPLCVCSLTCQTVEEVIVNTLCLWGYEEMGTCTAHAN